MSEFVKSHKVEIPPIRHLLILAGVSCAGKSTLIRQLHQEYMVPLLKKTGLQNPQSACYLDMGSLKRSVVPPTEISECILHFDFIHHALFQPQGFQNLNKLLQNSQTQSVLTLCCEPLLLCQRLQRRIQQLQVKTSTQAADFQIQQRLLYCQQKYKIYCQPEEIYRYYLKWEQTLAPYPSIQHTLLDSSRPEVYWLGQFTRSKLQRILNPISPRKEN